MVLVSMAVVVALMTSSASAITCLEAVAEVKKFDTECPKQCADDSDSLPKCTAGQKERTPATCGTDACGAFLAKMTDAVVDEMFKGLEACAKDAANIQYYTYAHLGLDYVKLVLIQGTADNCGHSGKPPLTLPALDTCMGGYYGVLSQHSTSCPRACNDGGEDDSLPACKAGQKERNPASCGTEKCGAYMESMDDAKVDLAITGLKACKDHATFSDLYQFSLSGSDGLKMMLVSSGKDCGVEDKLKVTEPGLDTCVGAAMSMGGFDKNCPKACYTDEPRDGVTVKCKDGEADRTPATCGNSVCEDFLAKMKLGQAKLKTGLKLCESHPQFKPYAAYADMDMSADTSPMPQMAKACGLDYSTITTMTTTTTTAPVGASADLSHVSVTSPMVASLVLFGAVAMH